MGSHVNIATVKHTVISRLMVLFRMDLIFNCIDLTFHFFDIGVRAVYQGCLRSKAGSPRA